MSNPLGIAALVVSAIGAIVSVVATIIAIQAQRQAKRALVSKEGSLPRGDNIEEYIKAPHNYDDNEDSLNG